MSTISPSPSAAGLPPVAAPAPRSGSLSPLSAQPERGEFSVTFRDEGENAALHAAETWLKARGFSIGTMQADAPRAIMLGEVQIAKWRNLSGEDHCDLHGYMAASRGRWRTGPIHVCIHREAPAAVIEAFNLSEEDLVDIAARNEIEAQP